MSCICVTGASGYLGKKIVSNIKSKGIDVIPIVRAITHEDEIVCDLTNDEMAKDVINQNSIDIIIHCAASVPKSFNDYNQHEMYESDVKMIENICMHKLKRFVFCSSMSVYGAEATGMLDEAMQTENPNAYASSKIVGENLLIENNQMNYAIARLPGLFGSGRKNGLIFNAINLLLKKKLPELPASPPAWSAMHVEDAAELMVRLAMNELPNRTICNIGYGLPQGIFRLMNELISLIKPDDLTPIDITDNWVCQNIDRQLRYIGYSSSHWYQRLNDEIEIMENSSSAP
jgi:nucleoside-diphosphate-sugar epimerase